MCCKLGDFRSFTKFMVYNTIVCVLKEWREKEREGIEVRTLATTHEQVASTELAHTVAFGEESAKFDGEVRLNVSRLTRYPCSRAGE